MANVVELYIKISTCGHCGRHGMYPIRRRMNTGYVEEESNYITECEDCFEETQNHWDEMWSEYHSMTR